MVHVGVLLGVLHASASGGLSPGWQCVALCTILAACAASLASLVRVDFAALRRLSAPILAALLFLAVGTSLVADKTNRTDRIENGELRMENGGVPRSDPAILNSQTGLWFTAFAKTPSNIAYSASFEESAVPYGSRAGSNVTGKVYDWAFTPLTKEEWEVGCESK